MSKVLKVLTEKSPALLCEEVNKRGIEPLSIISGNGSRMHAFYMGEPEKKPEPKPQPAPIEERAAEAEAEAKPRSRKPAAK